MAVVILPNLKEWTNDTFLLICGFMVRKRRQNVTIGFVALGCPKNVVDSERMLAQIAQAGFLITGDPSQADVVIVNTCGFLSA